MRLTSACLLLGLAGCLHPTPLGVHLLSSLRLPSVGPSAYQPEMLRGRVVMVIFMATWCVPCVAEIPIWRDLHRQYSEQGLEIVGVGMDLEGPLVIEPFAQSYQLPFPILIADEDTRNGRGPFGKIAELPSTFVVGKDGQILAAYAGVVSPQPLRALLERALAAP